MDNYYLTQDHNQSRSQGFHILCWQKHPPQLRSVIIPVLVISGFFLGAGPVWEKYSGQMADKKFLWAAVVITKGQSCMK